MKLCTLLVFVTTLLWLAPFAPGSARAATWQRPVAGPVVRAFAVSVDRFARGQHRGIDFATRPYATARAACGGRVSFAGRVPGGGRTVSIRCGRLIATYQHLGTVAVARGQALAAGAPVGTAGTSSLYLSARAAATGRYLDPAALLAPLTPAYARRRSPPLGLTPRAAPLRLAPPPVLAPAPARLPATPRSAPLPVGSPAPRIPLVVWLGLAACVLGLPLGGLVTRRRRGRGAVMEGVRLRA